MMFLMALTFQVVDALQQMRLRKLHLDVKVPHLCSDVAVNIEVCSPPVVVQFSRCPCLVSQFGHRSLE